MKKLFLLLMLSLIISSCEEDTTIHVYPEDKEVSLDMVNLITTESETFGKSKSSVDPYCSIEDNLFVSYNGGDEVVRVTFISKLFYQGEFIGYKWRLRNGTDQSVNNVRVGISGGTEVAQLNTLPANTEVFLFTQNPYAGVRIQYNDGATGGGTASSNEDEKEGCAPSQGNCEINESPMIHDIPNTFNVFFIPTNSDYQSFEFNNVSEGLTTFNVPAVEYTVTVTNYEDKVGLPDVTSDLYLIGEKVIDYGSVSASTILIDNPYSSIQVVKTSEVNQTPILDGSSLADVNETYFNIYTKVDGEETLSIGYTRGTEEVMKDFEPNKVYRFKLCKISLLELSSNVFPNQEDIILD